MYFIFNILDIPVQLNKNRMDSESEKVLFKLVLLCEQVVAQWMRRRTLDSR